MTNPVCDLLGIRYPILLGGMLYAGRAPLVAAVSAAGGLGILGAGRMDPEEVKAQIAQVRALTGQPFGVNIPLRAPRPEALVETLLAASVKVFAFSGGSPTRYVDAVRKAGGIVLQVVASVRQAVSAQAAGVAAVVAEGSESGGILARDLVGTLALVPQVVDAVTLPVIAAGGIADGRGLAAAFALGAKGVQMGTRFLASAECDIAADYKQALLMAADTDTWVFTNASGIGHRALKKDLLERAREQTAGQTTPPVDRTHHGRAAGQGAGLIHDIRPAGEIVRSIWEEARRVAADLGKEID